MTHASQPTSTVLASHTVLSSRPLSTTPSERMSGPVTLTQPNYTLRVILTTTPNASKLLTFHHCSFSSPASRPKPRSTRSTRNLPSLSLPPSSSLSSSTSCSSPSTKEVRSKDWSGTWQQSLLATTPSNSKSQMPYINSGILTNTRRAVITTTALHQPRASRLS